MKEIKDKIAELQLKADDQINHFHCFGQESCDVLAYLKTLKRIDQLKKKLNNLKKSYPHTLKNDNK